MVEQVPPACGSDHLDVDEVKMPLGDEKLVTPRKRLEKRHASTTLEGCCLGIDLRLDLLNIRVAFVISCNLESSQHGF